MAVLKLIAVLLTVGLAIGQKDCPRPCPRLYMPVCGTDGTTYSNECEFENAKCQGKDIQINYKGKCAETPGICPKPRIFGHCGYLCEKDADCRKGEKCCSNGCGKDCMKACRQLRCRSCPKGSKAKLDFNGCPTCECEDCREVPDYCTEKCERGHRVDKEGCTLCDCKPKCPDNRCRMSCPNGYVKNSEGCSICQCKPRAPCPPLKGCNAPCKLKTTLSGCPVCDCGRCPKLECPAGCGYLLDEDGCKKCKCPITTCPKLYCPKRCPYGQKVDDRGCLTCDCLKPLACPPPKPCPKPCALKKDYNGCYKCECPYICPMRICGNECEHGYKPDENGCITCECKKEVKCKPLKCSVPCLTGRMKDKNGCDTCTCKPRAPCPRPICNRGCIIVRGFDGCPTCRCKS